MSLKTCCIAGMAFTTIVCFCVFGDQKKRVVLSDPYGDQQAVEFQIEQLKKEEKDSSIVVTLSVLDTL